MTAQGKDRIRVALRKAGILRTRELESLGFSRTRLTRLCRRGVIDRIGRGLYTLPSAVLTERHSFAEAARQVPKGVVCLLSALRFHELTTQNPHAVWVAIDQKAWRPKRRGLRLQLVHLSGQAFAAGVEVHDVAGVSVRVYSAAKTVADCFKFRNKIGVDVAIEALRDFTRRYRGGADDLAKYARICRVQRVMQPYLDSIA